MNKYPRKSYEEAKQNLNKSLVHNNETLAIESMLNMAASAKMLGNDEITECYKLVANAIPELKDASELAFAYYLKALLLNSTYSGRQWKYDNTQTPMSPLPENITEWNGKQFQAQIKENISEATAFAEKINGEQSGLYARIADRPEGTQKIFPTLGDFITLKCYECLTSVPNIDINTVLEYAEATKARHTPGSWPRAYWWEQCISLTDMPDEEKVADAKKEYFTYKETSPASQIFLCFWMDNINRESEPAEIDQLVKELNTSIKKYPDKEYTRLFQTKLNELYQKMLTITTTQQVVAPGIPFEVNFKYANLDEISITLQDIKNRIDKKYQVTNQIPYQNLTEKVSLPSPGNYKLSPVKNSSLIISQNDKLPVTCTPFYPVVFSDLSKPMVVLADFLTGAPMKGVEVSLIKKIYNKPNKTIAGRVSSTNGKVEFDRKDLKTNGRKILAFRYGNFITDFNERLSLELPYENDEKTSHYSAGLYTDRPLYHPGDEVKCNIILTEIAPGNHSGRVATDKRLIIKLRDTNYKELATKEITIDSVGSADAVFVLPKEIMSGYFRLEVCPVNDPEIRSYGSINFMVSDFKMPSFEITLNEPMRDTPEPGSVTLTGKAETFTGMPVEGAKVSVNILAMSYFRWFGGSDYIDYLEAETDSAGNFSIEVPADVLAKEKNRRFFMASFTVTAKDGEAEEANCYFNLGKPCNIRINSGRGGETFDVSQKFTANIEVVNEKGEEISLPMKWKIVTRGENPQSTAYSGECGGGKLTIDLYSLPGGEYTLVVEPVDEAKAEKAEYSLTVYNTSTGSMPSTNLIFLPETTFNIKGEERTQKYLVGIPRNDTYLYRVLISGDKIIDYKIEKYAAGFHEISATIPNEISEIKEMLFTALEGKFEQQTVTVRNIPDKELKIKAESFRDNTRPEAKEKWTFRISSPGEHDGNISSRTGVSATMYNAALDVIANSSFNFGLPTFTSPKLTEYWGPNYLKGGNSIFMNSKIEWLGNYTSSMPGFLNGLNLSGYYFSPRIRGSAKMAAMTMNSAIGEYGQTEESVELMSAPESAVTDMAYDGAAGAIKEEVAEDEEEKGMDTPTDVPQINFRPSEVLQAFWKPLIRPNSNGTFDIDFEMPNALGKWSLHIAAWNSDLDKGMYKATVTSSKPVMVNPNLPRFLRAGDAATVITTIYNKTGELMKVKVTMQAYNPSNEQVINQEIKEIEISPNGGEQVLCKIEALPGLLSLGYRVWAETGDFTDGEQTIIPILPDEQEVIEGESFYIMPDEQGFETRLPEGKLELASLEYIDNPAWNIIKILPGISKNKSITSPGLANSLFEAMTAQYLTTKYPAVSDMLNEWQKRPEDSALVSTLEKNELLKQVTLEMTPWVAAGSSDTERMSRLTLLLDKKYVDKNIKSALKALRKLQNPDGGWRWIASDDKSSLWATSFVLNALSRLKLAGCLPESDTEIMEMARKGNLYYENNLPLKKQGWFQSGYVYGMSVLLGQPATAHGKEVRDYTVSQIMKEWSDYGPTSRARAAIILNLNGHEKEALEIAGTLTEFVAPAMKGEKGMGSSISRSTPDEMAEVLFALGILKPDAPEIDAIRQWLTMRTLVTTEAGVWDPTLLAAAFVKTGSNWFVPSGEPVVKVGGSALTLPEGSSRTGNVNMLLPLTSSGKTLSVISDKSAPHPSYGAIFTKSKRTITDIKAQGCKSLSIERKWQVEKGDDAVYADTLKVGDKIRVTLIIRAGQTLEYVTIVDARAACLEPVKQLPGYEWSGGVGFYRENNDTSTNLFVGYLPKGTYTITYEMTVNNAGSFISGTATAQSQLAPEVTAHSSGNVIKVLP